jgi:hypothetical protein
VKVQKYLDYNVIYPGHIAQRWTSYHDIPEGIIILHILPYVRSICKQNDETLSVDTDN